MQFLINRNSRIFHPWIQYTLRAALHQCIRVQQLNLNQVIVVFVCYGRMKVIRHVAIMHSLQLLHTYTYLLKLYMAQNTQLNKRVALDIKAGGGCTISYCALLSMSGHLASYHSLTCDPIVIMNFVVNCTSHVRNIFYLLTWLYTHDRMIHWRSDTHTCAIRNGCTHLTCVYNMPKIIF